MNFHTVRRFTPKSLFSSEELGVLFGENRYHNLRFSKRTVILSQYVCLIEISVADQIISFKS